MIVVCCDGNTATTSRHQRRQMCGSKRCPLDQESGTLPLSHYASTATPPPHYNCTTISFNTFIAVDIMHQLRI